jgi:hypothetical protein
MSELLDDRKLLLSGDDEIGDGGSALFSVFGGV